MTEIRPFWKASLGRLRQFGLTWGCVLAAYAVSHWIVWLAISQPGVNARTSEYDHFVHPIPAPEVLTPLFNWDGRWYAKIADEGYRDPKVGSYSGWAFFPLYSLIGGLLARISGMPTYLSLLAVSHVSFLAMLILLRRYGEAAGKDLELSAEIGDRAVLLMAFWPVAVFFHAAYTEALFALLVASALLMIRRGSNIWLTAVIVALATATRAIGVAIWLGFACYLLRSVLRKETAAWKAPVAAVLAMSGLLAFMVYQWQLTGDPFSFAEAQASWKFRPSDSLADHIWSLLNGDPIFDVYDPSSGVYWQRFTQSNFMLASLSAMNPVFFLFAVIVVAYGCGTPILALEEKVMSAAMLLIPYLSHSYEFGMLGQARYAMSVVPAFVVVSVVLARLHWSVFACVIAALAGWMFAFASEFAHWGSAI